MEKCSINFLPASSNNFWICLEEKHYRFFNFFYIKIFFFFISFTYFQIIIQIEKKDFHSEEEISKHRKKGLKNKKQWQLKKDKKLYSNFVCIYFQQRIQKKLKTIYISIHTPHAPSLNHCVDIRMIYRRYTFDPSFFFLFIKMPQAIFLCPFFPFNQLR